MLSWAWIQVAWLNAAPVFERSLAQPSSPSALAVSAAPPVLQLTLVVLELGHPVHAGAADSVASLSPIAAASL